MSFDGSDGHAKDMLVAAVRYVKAEEDKIAEIRADISERLKEYRDAGFDATKIREVVRWLRKVDKHGREKMEEAEAIFDLYRSVVDGGAKDFDAMMDTARDRALLQKFAGEDQAERTLSRRRQQMKASAALARAARAAREA